MDYTRKGLLVYREQERNELGQVNKYESMNRKQMQLLLKLGDSAFKKFIADAKNSQFLYEVEKKFYLDTSYFIKGSVDSIDKNSQSYCRLFIDTIRQIYLGTEPRQHKVLAYVFQLIPYTHYEYNQICFNPNENTDDIKAMSLYDVAELLGVSTQSSSNLTKLSKELYNFNFMINSKKYHLFTYVVCNRAYDYFKVNPLVVYRGNNYKAMCEHSKACFFNGNTHKRKRISNKK
jgi:hypothetical protein